MTAFRKALPALLPVLGGLGFIGLVWLNQHLFRAGTISAREAIGLELLYIVLFCGVLLWSFGTFLFTFGRRHAGWSLLNLSGLGLGIELFIFGLGLGAAILYVT